MPHGSERYLFLFAPAIQGGKLTISQNADLLIYDTAIMAAKIHTGRHEIVVLRHSYSGRSATALSAVGHGIAAVAGPA